MSDKWAGVDVTRIVAVGTDGVTDADVWQRAEILGWEP